jgi:hypothetical protein
MPELDRELDVSDKIDSYKVVAVVDSAKTISNQDVSSFYFEVDVVRLSKLKEVNSHTFERELKDTVQV